MVNKPIWELPRKCSLYENNQQYFQRPMELTGAIINMPWVILGDEAYPLLEYLM
jgi:hypothetical protein